MEWYLGPLKKYATFSGRATRKEYWMFYLMNLVVSFVVGIIDGFLGLNLILLTLYCLAILIPSISICVRRLHDIGKNGAWYLINFIPFGGLVFFVFTCLPSQPDTNEYGEVSF